MRIALGCVVAVLLVAMAASACRNTEVVTNTYATADEARQAGAIDRGWMPAFIPRGAHDLREAHDPGSRARWGLFSFGEADAPALRAAVKPGEVSVDGHVCDAPARIEWWPVMLRGRLRNDQIRATGLVTYPAQTAEPLLVAVNWKQGRAYYWTDSP